MLISFYASLYCACVDFGIHYGFAPSGFHIYNALSSVPEAKAAWDKIDLNNPIESAKKLTPQDYHALSSFLIGVVSGKNYLKGNLAERKVLQKSGINTESSSKIREYSNKFGLTRTKPTNKS